MTHSVNKNAEVNDKAHIYTGRCVAFCQKNNIQQR